MRQPIAVSCLAMFCAPLAPSAQQELTPPPITWCEAPSVPAERPEWVRRDVYLRLAATDSTRGDAVPAADTVSLALPVAAVGLVLEGITPHFVARAGLAAATPTAAPPGEPRYGPAVLLTQVRFVIRGDGLLDTVYVIGRGDSTFADDLVAAVRAAADERLLVTGDSTARHYFKLSATTSVPERGVALWRAFSLMAPRERHVEPGRMSPRMRYPPGLTNWRAAIILQFVVEPDGRPNPETIRSIHPPPGYVWPSQRHRVTFHRFLEEVRATIPKWRYRPAATAGCTVRQLVQQQFNFDVR